MISAVDPSLINGDRRLSADEYAAYVRYHRARNDLNSSLSSGVTTAPGPGEFEFHPGWSPSRHDVDAFFRWVGSRVAARVGPRPVTVVDIGCGAAFAAVALARAGLVGRYVGVDTQLRGDWPGICFGGLRSEFLQGDINRIDAEEIPKADVVVSATALEHIQDDRLAVTKVAERLSPDGVQAHFVPAEAALALYGAHGWRQYSPSCLRRLFPDGTIYRYGGPFTNRLHLASITTPMRRGRPDARESHPELYRRALVAARDADDRAGRPEPSMYGVVIGV